MVNDDSSKRSKSVKKASLKTFQNQRTPKSVRSFRKEESAERPKLSQRSKSPNGVDKYSRRSNSRSHTPRKKDGVNLISYFFEWMSRNNTVGMSSRIIDGKPCMSQRTPNRQLSVSRFEEQRSDDSQIQQQYQIKRRSRSSLVGLK